jgi:hypothetical protein
LDPSKLNRIATICHWGRSGSTLLASLLDDHPQVLALPHSTSNFLFAFFEDYAHLNLWQQMLVYPFYSALKAGDEGDFFLADNSSGDFSIDRREYVAAVKALAEIYASTLETRPQCRKTFIQFIHAAYSIALGKAPDASRAIIVTAQHYVNDDLASRLASDFPGAKFIHTVRDPISTVDSWFDRRIDMAMYAWSRDHAVDLTRFDCAVATMMDLISWECGHHGQKTNTRAVRF